MSRGHKRERQVRLHLEEQDWWVCRAAGSSYAAMVGTSGNASERLAVVTASARSLPALTYPIEDGIGSNVTCICPPSKSVSAGPMPRYGTWTRLIPAIIWNSSPATWPGLPLPCDAMLSLRGLALA